MWLGTQPLPPVTSVVMSLMLPSRIACLMPIIIHERAP
jgi:hypothetical protein